MKEVENTTFASLLIDDYKKWGSKKVAMRRKKFGIWQEYNWNDSYQQVKYFSLGLLKLGLEASDRIAIIGDNDPEWYWALYATQSVGGIAVGLFQDSLPSEIKYILEHSDSKFVVAKDQEQVDKFLEIKDELPLLKKVIYWDSSGLHNYDAPIITSWKEILELGKEYELEHPGIFEQKAQQVKPDDYANIFYTSGTTGLPKGARLTHRSLISSIRGLKSFAPFDENDGCLSFLPPAWLGEALVGTAAHLVRGQITHFPEKPETVAEDLRDISPSIFVSGPRQWEDFVSLTNVKIGDAGSLKKFSYSLLSPIGYKVADMKSHGQEPDLFWKILRFISDALVFRQLKDKLGLGNVKYGVTGSASLAPDVIRFFSAMGINLQQMYAGTEMGFVSGHPVNDIKFETIGVPGTGIEIRISNDRGEILIRSDAIFSGYHKNDEETEKVMTNGWFHTGDSGYIDDENGHTTYLDRVKDLGELKGGANYAPQYIETRLRFSPYIKDVLVIGGSDKDYVMAAINIDFLNVSKWTEKNKIPYTTFVDLSQKEEVANLILEDIRRINNTVPETSRVKKFVCLHKEFDPDEAELTRTRKLRRQFMEQKYDDIVNATYDDKPEVPIEAQVKYRDGRTATIRTVLKVREVS